VRGEVKSESVQRPVSPELERPLPPHVPGRRAVLKRLLVGRARPSSHLEHTLLPKFLALPVFSSDPLSSVAYATEEAMVVLVAASVGARRLVIPIAIAISLVMVIVIVSYRQTVRAYPTAAGSYVVSKDNLGTLPGLVAAAALLTDYVLTVAVSVVAGVLAITSAAPGLAAYRVEISIFFVVFIALANLRGVREAGLLFAVPTYGFVVAIFAMIAFGFAKCLSGCPQVVVPAPLPAGAEAIGIFVILHAFSSGSTALTGIEAISNGVSAFRRPQGRNAATSLTVMGAIAITAFLGVSFLAVHMGARPSAQVSVISEVARGVFPGSSSAGFMYYVVQALTFSILVLAANTSYQDFPRLSAILARDGFMPRQFENLGDRLVFSNGVVVLTVISCALIVGFRADVSRLIQLYVVGVFTAFTLSQAGMVHHWRKVGREGGDRARGFRRRMTINGIGAAATGVVTVIVVFTKFLHGAWIVLVAIPVFIAGFLAVHRHYRATAAQLRQGAAPYRPVPPENRPVLYVPDLGVATARALGYIRSFRGDDFQAVHVQSGPGRAGLQAEWSSFSRSAVPLEVIQSDRRVDALVAYLRAIPRSSGEFLNVVIPEVLEEASLVHALRGGGAFSLKLRLLAERRIAVTNVPVVRASTVPPPDPQLLVPRRLVALVLVSGINDAAVRAVNYARSLHAADTRAVFFAFEPAETEPMVEAWFDSGIQIPLDLVEAPFRDLGPPVLREVRRYTGEPGTLVTVVLPEVVVARRRHFLLHAQRSLFLKRLLLFEPNVVVTSVPYSLQRTPEPVADP
jgi:amino acid transporter